MKNDLRERAEELLGTDIESVPYVSTADVKKLIHELNVHEIELEMQNEELRRAQVELAHSRDAAAELYEFAPVGYLTLNPKGTIVEANFAGAAMLGLERGNLVGRKFTSFVRPAGADTWNHFHREIRERNAVDKVELEMNDARGKPFTARVEVRHVQRESPDACQCLLNLVDISQRVRVEEALQASETQLAMELAAMVRVHELVTNLFCCSTLRSAMDEVLGAVMQITDASTGFIRILNPLTGALEVVARVGFTPDDPYQRPNSDAQSGSTCGRAMATGERAIVEDVRTDPWYGPRRERATSESSFAVQSTPLISLGGNVVGTLCTHYATPQRPSDRDLRVLDLCARQAADYVERQRSIEAVRRMNKVLEHRVSERTAALSMLCDVASLANGASGVAVAFPEVMRRVSQENGWICGHAWLAEGGSGSAILPVFSWYEKAPPEFAELREAVEKFRLRPGDGIVGRVFAGGTAEVSNCPGKDMLPPKREIVEKLGIKSVCVFPILAGDEIAGVLEFFSANTVELAEECRASMASLGMLLGRVVERERAAKALQDREARVRGILETAADAIITFDEAGTIELFNPAAEHLFGYTAAEARGKSLKELMPFPYADGHDSHVARYLESGVERFAGFDRDIIVRHRNSSTFPVRLSVSELRGENGSLFIGIMHDLSERRELEVAVAEAAGAQQRFIGRELHDNLSQLMAGVEMTAAALKVTLERVAPEEVVRADLMLETVIAAQDVVQSLIKGLRPLHIRRQELLQALRELCDSVSKRFQLRCSLAAPTAIEAPDDRTATELYYIAQEAVNNAVQHAADADISIYIARRAGSIVLLIEDDGEGIDSAILESPSTGLKIMHYRAMQIGGHLTIARRPEGGTAVTLIVSTDNGE